MSEGLSLGLGGSDDLGESTDEIRERLESVAEDAAQEALVDLARGVAGLREPEAVLGR